MNGYKFNENVKVFIGLKFFIKLSWSDSEWEQNKTQERYQYMFIYPSNNL